ncbi:TOBE domain-containing protein [Dermacoccaceae bacterium W4C1]
MTQIRIKQAAALLGVSDDTVRRWCDQGRLATDTDEAGRRVVSGADLAKLTQELAEGIDPGTHPAPSSARNRLSGLVTRVVRDSVMAQVEMQCGPFRVVSLLSREAVDDLGLEPGSLTVATIKSTNVLVELAREH